MKDKANHRTLAGLFGSKRGLLERPVSRVVDSTSDRMKLLMLSTITAERGGLHARPYYMAKYLRTMPVDLRLVVFDSEVSGFLPYELIALPLSYYVRFKDLPSLYLLSRFLRHLIGRLEPDLIYAHEPTNILAAAIARVGRVPHLPIVGDLHGLSSIEMRAWGNPATVPIFRAIERSCTQLSSELIVASRDIKDELTRRRQTTARIHIIRNCVDTSEFFPIQDKRALRDRLELPPESKIVAFTAPRTFTPNVMAIYLLYRAASILERRSPHILFLILGGGEIPPDPRPGNVRYTGQVPNLNLYLNACDLAVAPYPSRAVCGGLRNKVLEYWACGLPVVSTQEGMRGFTCSRAAVPALIADYDPESIATAIERVANDTALAKELSEEARNRVLTEYSWGHEAQRLYDILECRASRG